MPTSKDIDQILAVVFAGLAALYLLRAGLGVGLYAAGALPGRLGKRCRTVSTRITPRLLRRVGGAILSASAVGGSVGGMVGGMVGVAPATAIGLDRGPMVSSTPHVGAPRPAPRTKSPAAPRVTDQSRVIVVRPGDCLWNIAARHLPADASAADIDRSWRRWYERNHTRIGPDPNLILTGSRLVAPR